METLADLRAALVQLNADANAILDLADKEGRDLTEDEEKQVADLMSDFDKTKKKIDLKEAVASRGEALGSSNGRATEASRPSIEPTPKGDDDGGFSGGIAEFATCVRDAMNPAGRSIDERLATPANFHREGGSSDGYMVPPSFRDKIWDLVFVEDDLLSMVDSEPTDSNSVQMLADETTPWGSTGIQAKWASEASKFDPSRMETQGREVKLHKMFAFVTATEELLEDAPRLESRLRVKAPEAIRWKATDAIMYGDGVGKPKGYFGSDALVSIAKESGQAADSVVAKNIAKMYARNLNPGRAHWIVNSDVLPEIMTLQIGSQPIWTPPNSGFKNAPGGFLLGRPIQFSEHAKTLGDKGDVQFVDPMGYYAPTKRGGIKFDSSIHLYFDYDLSAFRWTFRFGGQPYLSAPVTPKNGNSEKSHFVTLNERS